MPSADRDTGDVPHCEALFFIYRCSTLTFCPLRGLSPQFGHSRGSQFPRVTPFSTYLDCYEILAPEHNLPMKTLTTPCLHPYPSKISPHTRNPAYQTHQSNRPNSMVANQSNADFPTLTPAKCKVNGATHANVHTTGANDQGTHNGHRPRRLGWEQNTSPTYFQIPPNLCQLQFATAFRPPPPT